MNFMMKIAAFGMRLVAPHMNLMMKLAAFGMRFVAPPHEFDDETRRLWNEISGPPHEFDDETRRLWNEQWSAYSAHIARRRGTAAQAVTIQNGLEAACGPTRHRACAK